MRRATLIRLTGLLLVSSVFSATASAEVKAPPCITSHMVLQRDMAVPIWGQAAPGEKVTVGFRGQQKSATADRSGKWLARLDPLKAGGPDTLEITGANTITLNDVLVGEVWVGSGQSNMAGAVRSYAAGDPLLARAAAASCPQVRLVRSGGGGWQKATPENMANFSALLFAFGFRLHEELNVPVGLLQGAVGGTPSGHWLSEESYRTDEACKKVAAEFARTYSLEEARQQYQRSLVLWEKAVQRAKQEGKRPPRKPDEPQPSGECSRGKIGCLYEVHIRPYIPYGIRGVLWDQGESGTAICGVDQYTLMGALMRGWRKEWGQGDFAFLYVQKPSGGGCAWDPSDPVTRQADKFTPLPVAVPNTAAGLYRETHIRIMQYPNTAMVTSSDLGPGVHPINKSGYGARAARVALGMVYGRKVEVYGPLYQSRNVEGNKIRVSFNHVGQGLAYRNGNRLQGFAVAGEDKVFHWADAKIDATTVVVQSDKVAKPVAVRYAWGQTHPWANLFNNDGLPALPFRTDSW
jgi:sialate O-acetylesterase